MSKSQVKRIIAAGGSGALGGNTKLPRRHFVQKYPPCLKTQTREHITFPESTRCLFPKHSDVPHSCLKYPVCEVCGFVLDEGRIAEK